MAKFTNKPTSNRRDHCKALTDKIVAALEAGAKPWQKPWDPNKAAGLSSPKNAVTGRCYKGVNTLVLGMSPLAFASGDPRWCTYKQASESGWQVRRGEAGTQVYFYKPIRVKEDSGEDDTERTIPLLRVFTVFHASQIEGVPKPQSNIEETPVSSRVDDVDALLRNSGVVTRIGGDRAFYCPQTDHIQLPPDAAFHSREGWAATALHELAHASGAKRRLDRDLTGRFGSSAYAQEELRAELASVFLGAALALPSDIPNHASYIQSWIKALKDDKREIFRAAADAQKITDYLLAFHPNYISAPDDEFGNDDAGQGSDVALAA